MLKGFLEEVRAKKPLIHSIANVVTVNDCANALLAFGANPIMANAPQEAAEVTDLCDGLCLNLGTPNDNTLEAMLISGKKANEKGIPVVLDPVGTGASTYRLEAAKRMMDEIQFAAIRGNHTEISTLALGTRVGSKGVESDEAESDEVVPTSEFNLLEKIKLAKDFAAQTGAVVVITGATDVVADENTAIVVRNGTPMMTKVTGSGCVLSSLITATLAVHTDHHLEAVAACVCAMGICGETSYMKMQVSGTGNATFRNDLIDLLFYFTDAQLESGANYEVR